MRSYLLSYMIIDMGRIEELPQALRRRRQELGLSLTQVARRAGTSAATLSRYERGWMRFEVSTLRKLATCLGCTLDVSILPHALPEESDHDSSLKRLGRLFWDHDLVPADLKRHPRWVVGRAIEYGDLADIRFLAATLGRRRFLELTSEVRYSSKKAAVFWQGMREMEGTRCTRRPYPAGAAQFWTP